MLGSKCANCGNDPSLKHHNLVMCFWFQLTDSRILRYDQTSQKVEKYHNRPQKVQIMRKALVMKIIRNILYSHNEHTQRFCLPPTCSLARGRCSWSRSWCLESMSGGFKIVLPFHHWDQIPGCIVGSTGSRSLAFSTWQLSWRLQSSPGN